MALNVGTWWNNLTPLQRYFELNKKGLKGAEAMEKCSDHFDFWSEDWKNLSNEEKSIVERWYNAMNSMDLWIGMKRCTC